MKRIFTRIGLFAAAALLGISCVNTNSNDKPEPSTDGEVTFTASIQSRVADDQFETGDEIAVSALDDNQTVLAENVKYSYAADKFTSASPIKLEDGQELSYRAVYPFAQVSANGELSFSVQTDQREAANYSKSNLMSAFVGETSSLTPALDFRHLMAEVTLKIVASDVATDDVAAALQAKVSTVYNITTNSNEPAGDVEGISMNSVGSDEFKAVVVPQTIATGEVLGAVTLGSNVYSLVLDKEAEFKPGKKYSYEITISEGVVSFEEDINDWEEGDTTKPDDPDVPTEGWKYLGKTYLEDFVSLGFFNGTPAQLLTEVWEDYANPGFYKFVAPYDGYADIWQNVYGLSSQLPILMLNAEDILLDATDPDQVFFSGYSDGLSPLGLEVDKFGLISIGTVTPGTLVDGVVTFPAKGLFINITDGTALNDEAGSYYMNGVTEYVINIPKDGEEPEQPEDPENPDGVAPSIEGGIKAYWDGAELAEANPAYSSYSAVPIVYVDYEVSESTFAYYSAVLPDPKEGELESYTSEQILSTFISQGIEATDATDPANLTYVAPFNAKWGSKVAAIAIPVDRNSNVGDMLIQYITFSKDKCADIDDLLGMLGAPSRGAANVQVPFASEAQPTLKLQRTLKNVTPLK